MTRSAQPTVADREAAEAICRNVVDTNREHGRPFWSSPLAAVKAHRDLIREQKADPARVAPLVREWLGEGHFARRTRSR